MFPDLIGWVASAILVLPLSRQIYTQWKDKKDYETACVEAMVKGHTEALALIDGRLLALSSVGAVREHMTKTRGHVAMHLEVAQKLQAKP